LAIICLCNLTFAQSDRCFITEAITTQNNQTLSRVLSDYDKFGNVLSKETIQYFDGIGVSSKITYQYNSQNKAIKTEHYFKNQLTRTINRQYDNAGKLLSESEGKNNKVHNLTTKTDNKYEQVFLNDDGSVLGKQVSDINPEIETITKYNAQNNILSIDKKILSTSGKLVENQFEDLLGKVKKTEKYQYNLLGDITKKEEYLSDLLENYTLFEYISNVLIKTTAYTKTGLEDYRIEYKYTRNNQTEVLSYYRNELAGRTTKEYNSRNNCIKETNFRSDGQIINVTTFKYTCNQ
jgi:hypothetical protein